MNIDPKTPITITIELQKVAVIMDGLSELPFKYSAETFELIKNQVNAQIAEQSDSNPK